MAQPAIATLLEWANEQLEPHSDSPGLDARVLLQHVTKQSHSDLISHAEDTLTGDEITTYRELVIKRKQGSPIAYLTGEREFWSMAFKVTPATLIPRPDTELLVEQSLAHISKQKTLTVADIGTGCGAIVLALASERPETTFIAIDNSPEALTVAKQNREQLGITNVKFLCGDLLSPLSKKSCDIIVSNPPYIQVNDPHLNTGDVAFEPRPALVSGEDGLDAIRIIATGAPHKLKSQGWLLLEHGYDQAEKVRAIFQQAAFTSIETHCDLSGNERVTLGQLA